MPQVSGGFGGMAAGILAAAAVWWVVAQAGEVLIPFLLAALLAYLVNPAIAFLEARGLHRGRLVPALYGGFAALFILAAGFIVPWAIETAAAQQAKVPAYMALVRQLPAQLEKRALELPVGGEMAADGIRRLTERARDVKSGVPSFLLGLVPMAGLAGLVLFVSFFALTGGPGLIEDFVRYCPNQHVEKAVSLISRIDNVLGNYIRGMVVEAVVVAVLTWGGLALLGVRYAWEIALMAGLANMVPYLGPFIGGLGGAAVAFLQFQDLAMVGKVLVLAWLVQLVDNWIVQPAILRNAVDMHPVAVIFVLLLGGQLFGFFGLMFAVPAVCVLKEALKVVWDWSRSEQGVRDSSFSKHALKIPYV